jgi:hypothetical protein
MDRGDASFERFFVRRSKLDAWSGHCLPLSAVEQSDLAACHRVAAGTQKLDEMRADVTPMSCDEYAHGLLHARRPDHGTLVEAAAAVAESRDPSGTLAVCRAGAGRR